MKRYFNYVIITAAILAVLCAGVFAIMYRADKTSPQAYLEKIYGEENIAALKVHGDGHHGEYVLCYVPGGFDPNVHYQSNYILENKFQYYNDGKIALMEISGEKFTENDAMTLKLENVCEHELSFFENKFVVERLMGDAWYTVHTGEIGRPGNNIRLANGEKFELLIQLDELREVGEDEMLLPAGRYRISKEITVNTKGPPYQRPSTPEIWLCCNFEITA